MKPPLTLPLTENQIQRTVFQHLDARAVPSIFYFHPPNGGFRRKIEAAILKGLGVKPGVPDVFIVHNGQPFALELKTQAGHLTQAQRTALNQLDQAGAVTMTAYGLDDAINILETWGILKPSAQPSSAHAKPACKPADTQLGQT